jgi:hypothetical protein
MTWNRRICPDILCTGKVWRLRQKTGEMNLSKRRNWVPQLRICRGLPNAFTSYFKYVQTLSLKTDPTLLPPQAFSDLFIHERFQYDHVFDWTIKKFLMMYGGVDQPAVLQTQSFKKTTASTWSHKHAPLSRLRSSSGRPIGHRISKAHVQESYAALRFASHNDYRCLEPNTFAFINSAKPLRVRGFLTLYCMQDWLEVAWAFLRFSLQSQWCHGSWIIWGLESLVAAPLTAGYTLKWSFPFANAAEGFLERNWCTISIKLARPPIQSGPLGY